MRLVDKTKDLITINEWLKGHGKLPVEECDLPKIGMIVEDTACGFLCDTTASTCFLELFVTNPEALSDDRNKALNEIRDWAIKLAKASGYKQVGIISNNDSLLSRAAYFGFELRPVVFGLLNLK